MTPAPTAKLEWLEVMRGLAALWVLGHHAALAARYELHLAEPPAWIANGSLGVDFFFVLSGFIIAYSSDHLAQTGRTLRDYVRARAIRLYVPYLPLGLLMLAIYWALRLLTPSAPDTSTLSSLTLLPAPDPPALVVAWTLVHEVIFYAIFSVYFVRRAALWPILAAWGAVIAGVALADVPLSPFLEYFFSPLNLGFLLGVLVFQLTRRWRPSSRYLSLALAVSGGAVVALEAWRVGPDRLVVMLGFGALVLAVATVESPRRAPLPVLGTLGAASYSIYLVHKPMQLLAAVLVARLAFGAAASVVVVVVVSLLSGLAYWRFYERPALARMRAWAARRRAQPSAASMALVIVALVGSSVGA